ncbi:MAG: glycosyltransferase family 2 protein [Cyanobacteria bacterium P01_F01_bin.150]
MKISIITVCRNAEDFIETAIKSVVDQTFPNTEYIVVDGNSTDGTKEIIQKYAHRISCFISEPDGGIYEAMNKGIRYAAGDFIGFLNADDYLQDERAIEDAASFLSQHPTCDFLYGNLEVRYPSGKTILVEPPPPESIPDEMICGCLPHQASLARANLFSSRVGMFNESYRISSDYEWFLRMVYSESVKLCHYPRTLASYYAGGLSSQIRLAVPESYRIQNNFPLYKESYWVNRRLLKFQEFVVNLREWFASAEAERDAVKAQYEALVAEHQELCTKYEKLRGELGNPANF